MFYYLEICVELNSLFGCGMNRACRHRDGDHEPGLKGEPLGGYRCIRKVSDLGGVDVKLELHRLTIDCCAATCVVLAMIDSIITAVAVAQTMRRPCYTYYPSTGLTSVTGST